MQMDVFCVDIDLILHFVLCEFSTLAQLTCVRVGRQWDTNSSYDETNGWSGLMGSLSLSLSLSL